MVARRASDGRGVATRASRGRVGVLSSCPQRPLDSYGEIMSASEVVEYMSGAVGRHAVYAALRAGELPARRVRGRYCVAREALRKWLFEVPVPLEGTGHAEEAVGP